jgi:copper chaperone CopZ
MRTGIARIIVKNTFCTDCVTAIKKKVMEVKNVMNVNLYPSDSLVVFSFNNANQISEVLNILTSLGYPPKEDLITAENLMSPICNCIPLVHNGKKGVTANFT